VLTKQRKLERVLAKTKAEATSQDLNLKSDTIDLRIVNDSLNRAISVGQVTLARGVGEPVDDLRLDGRPDARTAPARDARGGRCGGRGQRGFDAVPHR
jgi:hypothetical protein